MDEFISKILKNRADFLQLLQKDLQNNQKLIENTQSNIKKIEDTINSIKTLCEKPEHVALVPLSKKIYLNATIKHTGEYYLERRSHPESYSVLQTSEKTLKFLELKILEERKVLERCEEVGKQLEERISALDGAQSQTPNEIRSDKGVAVKVGDLYEIFEFEE